MLFLDSSNPAEIKEMFSWGVLAGVTTNPLILSRDADCVDLERRIREVLAASAGPVSVELTSELRTSLDFGGAMVSFSAMRLRSGTLMRERSTLSPPTTILPLQRLFSW